MSTYWSRLSLCLNRTQHDQIWWGRSRPVLNQRGALDKPPMDGGQINRTREAKKTQPKSREILSNLVDFTKFYQFCWSNWVWSSFGGVNPLLDTPSNTTNSRSSGGQLGSDRLGMWVRLDKSSDNTTHSIVVVIYFLARNFYFIIFQKKIFAFVLWFLKKSWVKLKTNISRKTHTCTWICDRYLMR